MSWIFASRILGVAPNGLPPKKIFWVLANPIQRPLKIDIEVEKLLKFDLLFVFKSSGELSMSPPDYKILEIHENHEVCQALFNI